MNEQQVKLTKADLAAIEYEANLLAGEVPTLETLKAEGLAENQAIERALGVIAGAGRVLTLLVVEFVQAFGAVVLACLFILLEADRVFNGVHELGQHAEQAMLIAITLTAMNAVLPVYALRNVKSEHQLTRVRWTVRGHLAAFKNRLIGKPQTYAVDVYSNPALALAESAITWATLFLAFYAVLGPMLEGYQNTVWYEAIWRLASESNITGMLGLVAGLLLSIGGVFGVQSIAHELACRMLTDRPPRMADILTARRNEHAARLDVIRVEVRERLVSAKLAEQRRKVNAQSPLEEDTQPTPAMGG